MNSITKKQYELIKNKNTYAVVSGNKGIRSMTYSGLNVLKAVEEIMRAQKHCDEVLLIENLPEEMTSRNMRDYDKYGA